MKFLVLTAVLLRLTISGIAQNDTIYHFSLKEAQQFALENYYTSKNAALDIQIANKKVWETTAIGLPQISANVQGAYTPKLSASIEEFSSLTMLGNWMYGADQALNSLFPDDGFGQIAQPDGSSSTSTDDMKWSLAGTITVTQLIFNGSYIVGLQSAKVYKKISELNQEQVALEVNELISNSYFNVLVAYENKRILDSTYKVMNASLNEMKAMGNQGFVDETDVDQMALSVANILSSLSLIERMVTISENLLKNNLGLHVSNKLELTDDLDKLVDNIAYEQLLSKEFVLENNVTYAILNNQVKSSELLLKLDKSAYLPDLAAFYQYQKEFNDNAFSFTPPHTIGVALNIPIFNSGSKNAKVAQSKLEWVKATNTRDQMANAITLNYENSRSTLISAYETYLNEKKNLDLSKRIFQRSIIKFSNGLISSMDLAQIQSQFFSSQTSYYKAVLELNSAQNELLKMLNELK